MTEPAARDQLRDLVRAFRAQLEWRRRAGATGAPAGPTPAPLSAETTANTTRDTSTDAAAAGAIAARSEDAADLGSHDVAVTERAAVATPAARGESLAQVRADLGDCQRCQLALTRTTIVFGVGAQDAPLMFIGEAPGAVEDRRGEPFVGAAGQLLDRMLAAMGWTRDTVYIANVLKCRPPDNRDPLPAEIEACRPFLERQIASIAPRVIVTLGKPAAHLLLDTDKPMSVLRGKFHEYRGIPVMSTFHPAYLLRSPERKRETWDDLKQVIAALERVGVSPPHPPRS